MSDIFTPDQRHHNMAAIRAKNTKPEMIVRRFLWSKGYRYRLNHPRLPGKPDIVMRKYRTCIFINGCFWHGHNVAYDMGERSASVLPVVDSSECCKIPKSNTEFWVKKITRNRQRDIEVQHKLASMGWHCIVIWECELKNSKKEATLASLLYTLNKIFLQDHRVRTYAQPEETALLVAEDTEMPRL